MEIALDIFFDCKWKNIRFQVEWKPREHPWIQHADLGSESFDSSSFGIENVTFSLVKLKIWEVKDWILLRRTSASTSKLDCDDQILSTTFKNPQTFEILVTK